MKHTQPQTKDHWWQSIRWRLALGSTLVALLATVLLAASILLIITASYSGNQRQLLTSLSSDTAYRVGLAYPRSNALYQAAHETIPGLSTQQASGEQYLQLVYG